MINSKAKIPYFYTEKQSIPLFLVSVLIFTVLFVVVYRPANYMEVRSVPAPWNVSTFVVSQIVAGFFFVLGSHYLFRYLFFKHDWYFLHFILWIVAEAIIVLLVITAVSMPFNHEKGMLYPAMLWWVALNLTYYILLPYALAVFIFLLFGKMREVDLLEQRLVNQLSASDGEDYANFYDSGGKLAFSLRRINLLYLEAADNYCNIHYINQEKEDTFILRNSMKRIEDSEQYKGLVRCHRSYMVNIENVKSLRKGKDGLVLELTQGAKTIPVSKKYNEAVVRLFSGEVAASSHEPVS